MCLHVYMFVHGHFFDSRRLSGGRGGPSRTIGLISCCMAGRLGSLDVELTCLTGVAFLEGWPAAWLGL